MNKVILMGRLTKDPEIRYTQSSEPLAVVKYTLAVNRRFKKEGEPDADFIQCTGFGKIAEFAERFFKKGMLVAVSGRLQVRTWDDQAGQKHWSTDVLLEEQDFAESKSSFENRNSGSSQPTQSYQKSPQPAQSYNNSESQQNSNKSYAPNDFSPISESADDEDLPF